MREEYNTVQTISGAASLSFNSAKPKPSQTHANLIHVGMPPAHAPEPQTMAEGTSTQALRERAKQATAGIMMDIKQRQIYGFSLSDYQLAIRMAGEIPPIPADDLPPRFEQYVLVDIVIDIDGRVAEAEIVGGQVPPKIEQTLLSAIREFKYRPAQHNGAPIPSELEIVIHIPT